VHDLGRRRVAGVEPVDAEVCPHRREAAERLVAGEAVAALYRLGDRRGEEHRDVVAALGVAGGEHGTLRCLGEHPLQRPVPGAPEVGDEAGPVEMHVHGERRGRRVVAEPALLAAHVGEGVPPPAEFARHGDGEIAGVAQLLEVFVEEAVLAVVSRGALLEAMQHLLRQHRPARRAGGRGQSGGARGGSGLGAGSHEFLVA
jgi:hypothetical protein